MQRRLIRKIELLAKWHDDVADLETDAYQIQFHRDQATNLYEFLVYVRGLKNHTD